MFYVNDVLKDLMYDELKHHCASRGTVQRPNLGHQLKCIWSVICIYPRAVGVGGFLPAVKQIGNVAALPGIVGVRPHFVHWK